MIRFVAVLSFALLAALPVRAVEIQQVTSPDGVKAWLVEDHSIPFTALNILFRGGASLDAPGKRGAINLMTATLEEGAGDLDATQFAEKIEGLGADIGFNVNDDALSISIRALTENRDEAASLVNQALTEPRFDADAIERVRNQVQAVIRQSETDPQSIAALALANQAWGNHPYASSINGTAVSVAQLNRDDLLEAQGRVIARDRVIIAASGDITADELGVLIDKMLTGIPDQGAGPMPEQVKFQAKGGVTIIDWDSPQTVISFAQPGLAMDDPDYFAAFVANHILGGGGFSSRLMDEIREKRGLTYGISSSLVNGLYGQSWQGGMASANEKVAMAVDLIRQEWAELAQGVTEQEITDAKTYLTGEYPLRFDGNGKISAILAGMQLMNLPADYPNTRNDHVMAVTAEDVKRVAKNILDQDALRFVLVGRPEGMESVD